jgi:hypothetical protein
MNRDGAIWYLWCGDVVKTAFLQGEPDPRDEPLYLAPPRDQISILAKVFTSPLVPRQGEHLWFSISTKNVDHACLQMLESQRVDSALT